MLNVGKFIHSDVVILWYITGLEVLLALCLLDVRNNLLSSHQTLDCLRYLSHLQQVSITSPYNTMSAPADEY